METLLYGALAGSVFYGLTYMAAVKPEVEEKYVEQTDNDAVLGDAASATQLPPVNLDFLDEDGVDFSRRERGEAPEVTARTSEPANGEPASFGVWGRGAAVRQQTRDLWTSGRFHGEWAPYVSTFE